MRRGLTVTFLLAIAAAACWTILDWQDPNGADGDPWRAIPSHAAVIIEVPDIWATWDRFTHTSLLWRSWEEKAGARALASFMTHAAKAMESDADLRRSIGSCDVLITLIRSGPQGTGVLFTGVLQEPVRVESLSGLLGVGSGQIEALRSGRIVQSTIPSGGPSISACVRDGVWMISMNAAVLEEAVVQIEKGTPIGTDPLLMRARETWGAGADAHILLRTGRALALLNGIWEAERTEALELPDGWMALDLETKPDALLLGGFLVPAGNDPHIAVIADQGTGPWDMGRLLPRDVMQWEVWNVGDAERFLSGTNAMSDSLRPGEWIFPWTHGYAGSAQAIHTADSSNMHWAILGTEDPEVAREQLEAPCGSSPCDTLNHRGVRITRFPQQNMYERCLGRKATLPQQPWWAILGTSVVMSDDPAALRASIDTWNDGNGLAESKRASGWFRSMSDEAAFTWWCDPARGPGLFRGGLRTGLDSAYASWVPILSELGALSIQVSPASHGLLHVAIGVQHAPLSGAASIPTASNVLWSCSLDAPVKRRPEIVINHTNGTREVLVQDTLDRIHLISALGKVVWSRQLDGPILGTTHQVDRFKNSKLQLLFNTSGFCYLIDRNGNNVEGFPFTLASKASAPLAVFDYDGQRDYRVLIPTADRNVINLGLDGVLVQGWDPPRLDAAATEPVHHLRIRNKDYLLLIDQNGDLNVLDRKGAERERSKTKLARMKEVHAVIPGPELMGTRIHWMDEDLVLHETTLGGEERRTIGASNGRNRLMDLDGDGSFEVVRVSDDSLVASNAKGILFANSAGPALDAHLELYTLGTNSLAIGGTSPSNSKAWLYDPSGLPLATMPVDAATPFALGDLNLDGLPELITTIRAGKVVAYRVLGP